MYHPYVPTSFHRIAIHDVGLLRSAQEMAMVTCAAHSHVGLQQCEIIDKYCVVLEERKAQ